MARSNLRFIVALLLVFTKSTHVCGDGIQNNLRATTIASNEQPQQADFNTPVFSVEVAKDSRELRPLRGDRGERQRPAREYARPNNRGDGERPRNNVNREGRTRTRNAVPTASPVAPTPSPAEAQLAPTPTNGPTVGPA